MWAGGKNKMLEKYQPFLPETFKSYVEPFFGGGVMFIWAY
jgi:site-specific DNA-adenine methylase